MTTSGIGHDPAKPASGRFLLRLSPSLHDALRRAASRAGLSLNEYCCRKLAAPFADAANEDGTAAVVDWASQILGGRLVAVVVYGSWARGEAQRGSDVDLLVVADPQEPITRELYRRWDERRPLVDGRTVDPHFVHVPGHDRPRTGLWAEAALDGIVLFERGHEVSRCLSRIRRDLLSGRLVRKTSHGQPYWAEVA